MKRKLNFKLIAIFLVVTIASLSIFWGFKFFGNRSVLKFENFSITSDMMSYLIKREAEEYIDYHKKTLGSNFSNVVKLSLDKNLKRQKSPYNKSWYDYFYEIAYEKSKELISINEEVLKQKITFSEDINAFVEKESKSLTKKYKVSSSDLKQIIRLQKNAEEYKKLFEQNCSEETYNKYYENNRKHLASFLF